MGKRPSSRSQRMNVGIGGRAKRSYRKWMFFGRWWKPWTWLRWKRVTIIREFDLFEVSLVKDPVDSLCKINLEGIVDDQR